MINLKSLQDMYRINKVAPRNYKSQNFNIKVKDLLSLSPIFGYPNFVKKAVKSLKNFSLKLAIIATAFPTSISCFKLNILDIKMAVDFWVDEIGSTK